MPQLIYRIMGPDNQAEYDDLVDALARKYGYTDTIVDPEQGVIPNPLTKLQFLRRYKKSEVRADYIEQKKQDASQATNPDPGFSD